VANRRTIWAREAQLFLGFVAAGYPEVDVAALARAANLEAIAARDPEAGVPIADTWQLWQLAVRASGDRTLAIRYGLATRLEHLGVFGFAVMTASTVRGALDRAARFLHLITDSAHLELHERGARACVRWQRDAAGAVSDALANETVLAQIAAAIRQTAGPRALAAVEFRHPPPDRADAAKIERLLGCATRWGARADQLVVPAHALARKPTGAHPELSTYFVAQADARAKPPSLVTRIAGEIEAELHDGEPDSRVIAKRLAMSERTLRRTLAREQTSFRAVLDEVRGRRAELLLGDPRLSLTEIAFALGFAEHSAFTRAFKRWFGVAPARYRRTAA